MPDEPAERVQFAVVREDPELDATVLARTRARRALLVASGGCTAFTLLARFPGIELTLVDPNPAQLDLVRRKLAALRSLGSAERLRAFNVGDADPSGLCECGSFEALFRQWRAFLFEFVAPEEDWRAFLSGGARDAAAPRSWFRRRWWSVAFELFFSDPMLEAMFTRAATQHAAPGSYPRYFRAAFERGLTRDDAASNYFLHHALLGRYRNSKGSLPPYLETPPGDGSRLRFVESSLEDVADFSAYDFVGLSNVMDWMSDKAVERLARRLRSTLAPGAALVWRQLNNDSPREARFAPRVRVDARLSAALLRRDRSLFYRRVRAGFVEDRNASDATARRPRP